MASREAIGAGLGATSPRVDAVMDALDDTQKQQLLRPLIEDVHVTGWHRADPAPPHPTGPTGKPSDGLRSVGGHRRRLLPHKDANTKRGTPDPPLNYPQGAGFSPDHQSDFYLAIHTMIALIVRFSLIAQALSSLRLKRLEGSET